MVEVCGKGYASRRGIRGREQGVWRNAGKKYDRGESTFAAGLRRVRKENWAQRQRYKRRAGAVVNYKIRFFLLIVGAFSPENERQTAPERMVCSRLRPFENEKARNEHRVWLGAASAETIEKFLAAHYCCCF